jgi:hypothetical protein
MSELLQEYVDSRHERLRVDRTAGVIRGVKLLGLSSRNGRRYREEALVDAVGLYEGAKVNMNHPKGHPLSPRDYQDRLGVVRGVEFRAGEGLFGDLHFNPKHALSEQLVWDAEHAPQNLGMSHNVLARVKRNGEETDVEAITKVQSIDLVADPATTSGLYEHAEEHGSSVESREVEKKRSDAAFEALTLEELRHYRPDLVRELERPHEAQLEQLRSRMEEMIAAQEAARRKANIVQLLQEHDLPFPSNDSDTDSQLICRQFVETLMRANDDEEVRRLVEERASLVRSAYRWNGVKQTNSGRPRSRDQFSVESAVKGSRAQSAAEFAAAIRR